MNPRSVVNIQVPYPAITAPAAGLVAVIPPATAPSIYFAGSPAFVTVKSYRFVGNTCQLWGNGFNPVYAGPAQIVPVSSLGLTLPFSIK